MRMSLLMRREPLGNILERTLENFWSQRTEQNCKVEWLWMPKRQKTPTDAIDLACNIYLNAIFSPDTANGALDPIRREFTNSTVAWRAPLQRLYCQLALSPNWSSWFKQAILRVSPRHEWFAKQVVVPGNNKIRILDHANRCAFGILKHGFSSATLENEIQARGHATELGIPIPQLLETDSRNTWFREAFVAGTPLNRLTDPEIRSDVIRRASSDIRRLAKATTDQTSVGEYVTATIAQIEHLQGNNHLLDEKQHQAISTAIHRLAKTLSPNAEHPLTTSLTHGDFQPANILVNGQDYWIIDWEYAARRQIGYDQLVLDCDARTGERLKPRLTDFVERQPLESMLELHRDFSQKSYRNVAVELFLLEELALRLSENTNAQFTQLDHGLTSLISELESLAS